MLNSSNQLDKNCKYKNVPYGIHVHHNMYIFHCDAWKMLNTSCLPCNAEKFECILGSNFPRNTVSPCPRISVCPRITITEMRGHGDIAITEVRGHGDTVLRGKCRAHIHRVMWKSSSTWWVETNCTYQFMLLQYPPLISVA